MALVMSSVPHEKVRVTGFDLPGGVGYSFNVDCPPESAPHLSQRVPGLRGWLGQWLFTLGFYYLASILALMYLVISLVAYLLGLYSATQEARMALDVTGVGLTLMKLILITVFIWEVILRLLITGPVRYCKNIWNILDFIVVVMCLIIDTFIFVGHSGNLQRYDSFIMAFRLWYVVRMIRKISIIKEDKEDQLLNISKTQLTRIEDQLASQRVSNCTMETDLGCMISILQRESDSKVVNDPNRMLQHSISWHNLVPHQMALSFKPKLRKVVSNQDVTRNVVRPKSTMYFKPIRLPNNRRNTIME